MLMMKNNADDRDGEDRDQHSFMQESSLYNLFPAANQGRATGGMLTLESCYDGKSQISRPDQRPSSGIVISSDNINQNNFTPIGPVQKQDMSHLSDDDLHFFLGSQGLN